MKKLIFVALICIIATWLFADGSPRVYTQKISNETTADGQLPDVINGPTTTAPNYHLTAWVTTRPDEVLSTNPALDTDETAGASLLQLFVFIVLVMVLPFLIVQLLLSSCPSS